jgi:hypothetical protein
MRLLGMDTCPSLNDTMKIRCNKCTRSEQGYTIFKPAELHALCIIVSNRVDTCNLMLA